MQKVTDNEMRDLKIASLEEEIERLNQHIIKLECEFEMNGLSLP
jgi:hypothetical protein